MEKCRREAPPLEEKRPRALRRLLAAALTPAPRGGIARKENRHVHDPVQPDRQLRRAVTPMNDDYSIDYAGFAALLDFQARGRHERGADHGLLGRGLDAGARGAARDRARDDEASPRRDAAVVRLHRPDDRGDDRLCPAGGGRRAPTARWSRRPPTSARRTPTSCGSSSTWRTPRRSRSASTTTRRG